MGRFWHPQNRALPVGASGQRGTDREVQVPSKGFPVGQPAPLFVWKGTAGWQGQPGARDMSPGPAAQVECPSWSGRMEEMSAEQACHVPAALRSRPEMGPGLFLGRVPDAGHGEQNPDVGPCGRVSSTRLPRHTPVVWGCSVTQQRGGRS